MRKITSIDGTKFIEYHMSAGKGLALNAKFGRNLFSLNSEEGLMQIAGLDPVGGYELFMELTKVSPEELDNFDTDAIWEFLEGVFTDFFPKKIRPDIPKMLLAVKAQVMKNVMAQLEVSQETSSNSATGSAELSA